MKYSANKPVMTVRIDRLRQAGITDDDLRRYLPRYILDPTPVRYGRIRRAGVVALRWFLTVMVKLFLSPRASSGSLGRDEIDRVYTREAKTYGAKHHLTTRGMDLVWRRAAGWFAASIAREKQDRLKVLDLCTGTGLTVKEIYGISRELGIDLDVVGLDFNERMLEVARRNAATEPGRTGFVRGDAMCLGSSFAPCSFDIVTQVFGIGGIPEPVKVFDGVLRILKEDGRFLMIDMHKPIPELPGEWPLFLKWLRLPVMEMTIYEEGTIPIVLNRLWGWRDTTPCFYLLPLVTYRDDRGRYWGFEVRSFEQESQRWWLALPLMPVARITAAKVGISEDTARKRQAILDACNA